jgi:hypothetical protein
MKSSLSSLYSSTESFEAEAALQRLLGLLVSRDLGRGSICLCANDARESGAQDGGIVIEGAVVACCGCAARTEGFIVRRKNPFRVSVLE